MTSQRFPGKVLAQVGGRPLLEYTLDRLEHCDAVGVICVATSREDDDDPIADLCARRGVRCHRGSLRNVARRLLRAAEGAGSEAFFRSNGDSPMLATEVYGPAARTLAETGADLVTNVSPRELPPGASVELIRTAALAAAVDRFTADEAEHVTLHFYRNPSRFIVKRVRSNGISCPKEVKLTVDEPSDLSHFSKMLDMMERPHWTYSVQELCDLWGEVERA